MDLLPTRELIIGFILFMRVNCLSTERYLADLFFQTSKVSFGQVHYGHLLVPGQVENFTISTPLVLSKGISSITSYSN